MQKAAINRVIAIIFPFILFIANGQEEVKEGKIEIPPQFRFIRLFGDGNESKPPILVLSNPEFRYELPLGCTKITIEFDFDSPVPPTLYAKFVHCSADWTEDENIFLNDIGLNRTSNITWERAPMLTTFYTYRGNITVPNEQVAFKYGGNWKVKLYEFYNDSVPLAEGKFYVIMPKANCTINVYRDFYEPTLKVAPVSYNVEAVVSSNLPLMDNNINTAVIYRNHRWSEPYIITTNAYLNLQERLYKQRFRRMSGGIAIAEKRFRIEGIPVENEYRVLDMNNLASFPRTSAPVRLPFSDLRRTGSYFDLDDDGAMITGLTMRQADDYVDVEFVMDPDGWISKDQVFVSGSFNNWNPDRTWEMHYDDATRLYILRHWVPRGRHNYLYVTGDYNWEHNRLEKRSYEEFEGNASTIDHTFIGLIYYREFEYGGYDSIIAVGAANITGSVTR